MILKIFKKLTLLFIIFLLLLLLINHYVKKSATDYILKAEEISDNDEFDAILILGCKVNGDKPSAMLEDRLIRGIELYERGVAPKILMSGDHSQKEYDEVGVMKKYAVDNAVLSTDVFMDHAGFSTYESLYRAKEIFGAERVVIVTQKYHLYRALYLAQALGIDAVGVDSDYREYFGQIKREVREVLARAKDYVFSIIKPLPKYLGDKISLDGDGNLTDDKIPLI